MRSVTSPMVTAELSSRRTLRLHQECRSLCQSARWLTFTGSLEFTPRLENFTLSMFCQSLHAIGEERMEAMDTSSTRRRANMSSKQSIPLGCNSPIILSA
jgi:hypothetical protein